MPTPLLLGITGAFEPPTVWSFVDDVTKLGILHVHARQTCCLKEPPLITRITDTTMYLPPPPNILAHHMLSTPPSPNQYSQRPSYRSPANRHNTMGYPYPQDAIYTNPSRRPTFQSTDHTDN